MDVKFSNKIENSKKTVMVRVELPKRTHRKLKAFNLSQPKETIANSAVALIEKALETATI